MDTLETKSLEELRTIARASGLRGYSGLRKKQLIELLAKQKARPSVADSVGAPTPKKAAKSKPVRMRDVPTATPEKSGDSVVLAGAPRTANVEERIEVSKFEMTPPGVAFAQAFASTLYEDIDRLPAIGEPVLCLLPQKPGVVHAYWALQPGAETKHLRLRLCSAKESAIELLEEIKINGDRGHWYFQVPQTPDNGEFFAHLGYYDARGAFVTAIQRGIARIPTLYASTRTDRSWWISDEDFRAMYLRAGGTIRARQLYWPAATDSSPINAPSSPSK
jgi:hypothetical protein